MLKLIDQKRCSHFYVFTATLLIPYPSEYEPQKLQAGSLELTLLIANIVLAEPNQMTLANNKDQTWNLKLVRHCLRTTDEGLGIPRDPMWSTKTFLLSTAFKIN